MDLNNNGPKDTSKASSDGVSNSESDKKPINHISRLDNERVCDICLHNIVKNVVFLIAHGGGFDIEARLFTRVGKNIKFILGCYRAVLI